MKIKKPLKNEGTFKYLFQGQPTMLVFFWLVITPQRLNSFHLDIRT